jgi:hypothetical protein
VARKFQFGAIFLLALCGCLTSLYAAPQGNVILVDDFDQAYSSNHLGGAYGIVAQGGEARYDFVQPTIPYLANNSSLKISYKLKSYPGYAFLWMKLGKHNEAHELSDYLNLKDFVFLSFKYQAKQDINFKIEIHEDINNDGKFDVQQDRSSFVYMDTVKKFPVEGGWSQTLIPLKRFSGIKDWSKILELVFVFEKDYAGTSGEIYLEDIIFIKKELKKKANNSSLELVKDSKVNLNDTSAANGAKLQGENRVEVSYQKGPDFNDLESITLEIKNTSQEKSGWVPVTRNFNPGEDHASLIWDTFTFNPPDALAMRIVARDFLGKTQVLAGPFENLKVPKMTDNEFLNLVERQAFFYFLNNQNLENGLFYDTTGGGDLSTAVTGFGLSALVIGAERGWITKAEAASRIRVCLKSFLTKIEDKEGFYYHFLTPKTLQRAGKAEVSTVDTALLLTGVITAGEYFGGDIKKMSDDLYKKANWDFYLEKNPDEEHYLQFRHGWTPEDGLVDNYWDYYTDETLLLDLLAIGAPKHSAPAEIFYKFQRRSGQYKDLPAFIYTWHGSLFSYQYANAWYNFEKIKDKEGVNWFENSKKATLSNRAFSMDHSTEYKTYSADRWGITSMRVPERYIMHYGPTPNGQNKAEHDGTISPSGPAGSIVFTPYISFRTLKYFYLYHPDLWGIYGFKDSLNIDRYWISPIYYGLGEGIILLSIENFRTGLIWNNFQKNKWVKKGLSKAKFEKDENKFRSASSLYPDFKKELDQAPDNNRLALIKNYLERSLSYEDLNLLEQDIQQRYAGSSNPQVLVTLGRLESKKIEALQANDLTLGRLYLTEAENHKVKAMEFFDKALTANLSEVERLEVFKDRIALLHQTLDPLELENTENRLIQELKDGIKREVYNLAWALKWAEQLDEETSVKLRGEFFADLSARERKILFELLKRKTKAAFSQGDYGKAANLSEEQIRFMDQPSYRRVLVGFLERTGNAFAEVQKYAEAEKFYLQIIDQYGDDRDKEKMIPQLASMYDKKGDKESAIKQYEHFMELFPKSNKVPEAMTRIANIESGLGNKDKAIVMLKKIGDRYAGTPDAEESTYLLGMVYYHAQRYNDAIKTWEKFLKDYPATRHVSVVRDYLEKADKNEAKS